MNHRLSKNGFISTLTTLALVLAPILSMYQIFGLRYDFLLCIVLVMLTVLIGFKRPFFIFPQYYILFWGYLAISCLLANFSYLRPSLLIPGGITFAGFSLYFGVMSKYIDFVFFKKSYRIIFLGTLIVFVLQEIQWYTTGMRIVPILPLGNLSTALDYSGMILRNTYADRSASIFFEPAHYAVFILPLLTIELFDDAKKRIARIFVILLTLTLLLMRSGTGLLGLSVLLVIKTVVSFKKWPNWQKIIAVFIIPVLFYMAFLYYANTRIGSQMLGRTEELTFDESGHSFARIGMGFYIYDELPFFNKIVGASDDDILPIAIKYISSVTDRSGVLFLNGLQYILTRSGIIGLFLFLLVIVNLYRNNNVVSKSLVWVFLVVSMVEQTYCLPLMLVVWVLANYFKNVQSQ